MRPRQAFGAGNQLIDARVVLHRAGAQRIEPEVNRVVPGGKTRKMANDFELADFGKFLDFRPYVPLSKHLLRIHVRHVQRRQADSRVLPGELSSNSSGSF